jgi:hypothetical protein
LSAGESCIAIGPAQVQHPMGTMPGRSK